MLAGLAGSIGTVGDAYDNSVSSRWKLIAGRS